MKTKMKTMLISIFLLSILAASCTSTGEYKPLSDEEVVIGTVQTTFIVRSTFFSMKRVKDRINTESYIKLLEASEKKYSGNTDIRDIIWVTGQPLKNDPAYTEIFASGKVILKE